jgi:two-component system chemotaxis response regulator CheY
VRTLIVDDSPIIRLLLQRLLISYGECESAKDGQEAIDAYTRHLSADPPFDLVCLDLGLPKIDGMEVLEKIREIEAKNGWPVRSRVLVITASTELSQGEVMRQGADGYLLKPIDNERLVKYLRAFGLSGVSAGLGPCESPINRVEAMCDMDTIPVVVLARLIQRMAASIGRQLSDRST